MLGIRTSTVSVIFVLTASGLAAAPEYFPLAVGNSWMYKSEGRFGKEAQSIQINGAETIDDRTYYVVEFFGRTALLRMTDGDRLVAYNRAAKSDETWLAFSEADGASFPTAMDQCNRAARIESKAAKFSGPFGEHDNALHVVFEPSCADAGLTDAWFLPYIGMVRYSFTTIAGPRTYDLVYSKTGVTEVAAGLVSTRLALDAGTYKVPRGEALNLVGRLSVQNTSDRPIELKFTSGQRFDLAIKNARGEVINTWSKDKLFIQVLASETIAPGAERSWVITLPLTEMAPGQYTAEAWLTTSNTPPKAYSASVGFDIVE